MIEVWKDIKGFEKEYMVSSMGNVKSLTRIILTKKGYRKYKGRILKPGLGSHGYFTVRIKGCSYLVHRLVADAFCANTGTVVNHLDGNKQNNKKGNLEKTTNIGNFRHASKNGFLKRTDEQKINYKHFGSDNPASKLSERDVVNIKHKLIKGIKQKTIADEFGINQSVISRISSGKAWKHF